MQKGEVNYFIVTKHCCVRAVDRDPPWFCASGTLSLAFLFIALSLLNSSEPHQALSLNHASVFVQRKGTKV